MNTTPTNYSENHVPHEIIKSKMTKIPAVNSWTNFFYFGDFNTMIQFGKSNQTKKWPSPPTLHYVSSIISTFYLVSLYGRTWTCYPSLHNVRMCGVWPWNMIVQNFALYIMNILSRKKICVVFAYLYLHTCLLSFSSGIFSVKLTNITWPIDRR